MTQCNRPDNQHNEKEVLCHVCNNRYCWDCASHKHSDGSMTCPKCETMRYPAVEYD